MIFTIGEDEADQEPTMRAMFGLEFDIGEAAGLPERSEVACQGLDIVNYLQELECSLARSSDFLLQFLEESAHFHGVAQMEFRVALPQWSHANRHPAGQHPESRLVRGIVAGIDR